MNLTATVHDAQLQRTLDALAGRMRNLKPAMDEIGQRYERRVLENVRAESAPDGTKWQKLSAATLQLGIAASKGFGKRGLNKAGRTYLTSKSLLVASGRMRSRLHYQADAASARVGINGIPYAAIHQFGGMAGRGHKVKIPARPYLAMNTGNKLTLAGRDRSMVLDVLQRHLAQG